MSVYLENLYNGDDFHTTLTRSEFETSFDYFQPLMHSALQQALDQANITLEQIH